MYYKIVNPILPESPKHSIINRNLKIFFLVSLAIIPIVIYILSLYLDTKRNPIEATFLANPQEISTTRPEDGIKSEDYSEISIIYKNNTKNDLYNLKLFIPAYVVGSKGKGTMGIVARRVPIDNNAYAKSNGQYIVLDLPDIKAGKKQNVVLVSFYSKIPASIKIQGEIRTQELRQYIVNPVEIVIK